MNNECPHCFGEVPEDYRWETFADGSRHIRARCLYCRKFLRFAPQTPEIVAAAKPEIEARVGNLFDDAD